MNITARKSDTANVLVTAKIENADIEKSLNRIARRFAKTQSIDGFRRGKVPIVVIKKIYGDKLRQEAENNIIDEVIKRARKELNIKQESIIGDPIFKKYNKGNSGIEIELTISLQPTIETKARDYYKLAPKYIEPTIEESEIEQEIEKLIKVHAPYQELEEDRALAEGDQAIFDFISTIDGVKSNNEGVQNYELIIGSNQFVDGFEKQMVGMKRGERREIVVTFPENYQPEKLAGKKALFTVTLKGIKVATKTKLDQEMLNILVPDNKNATEKSVKEQIKKRIRVKKIAKIYNEELKPKFIETLVEEYNFDLPENIVEQEIDAQVSQKAQTMSEEELNRYKENSEKLTELRESLREDAVKSVKATFLIDALAKREGIIVSDRDVTEAIYYEAMTNYEEPQEILKYYHENNLIPAVKMGIIEDRLFSKILGL